MGVNRSAVSFSRVLFLSIILGGTAKYQHSFTADVTMERSRMRRFLSYPVK